MSMVIVEELKEGIVLVTLNRPEKRNALSIEMRYEIAKAFNVLSTDDACRGAVLTGAGTSFCAGMDFTQFGGDTQNKRKLVDSTEACFQSILQFPKPLVGALNGPAVGGGFSLALCMDVNIASERAYFGFFEVKRGIPAPCGVIRVFVSEDVAKDLTETGRRFEVSEALQCGIVKKIVPSASLIDECVKEVGAKDFSPLHNENTGRKPLPQELLRAFEEEQLRFKKALIPDV